MSPRDLQWLERSLQHIGAVAGTVHRVVGGALHLTAAVGIPAEVLASIQRIPHGKGMAGLAWLRHAPVLTCDLRADRTGDIMPGARAVEAHAAVALPLERGDSVAVVGFAYLDNRAIEGALLAALTETAHTLPRIAQTGD
jgi:hypothetical protein